jgi:hypothetical protein
MKLTFVALGAAGLAALGLLLARSGLGRPAMIAAAVATLWYLPVGTVTSVLVIVLLLLGPAG